MRVTKQILLSIALICAPLPAEGVRLLLGSGGFWNEPQAVKFFQEQADAFLGPVDSVLVIPYATFSHPAAMTKVAKLRLFGNRRVENIDAAADPVRAVRDARAIFVLGGNTFRLLKGLQDKELIAAIRERVAAGVPYIGVSAGSNVACPTIKTTNDMPIVEPRSLQAIGLVPFQINPHYFPGPTRWRDADGKEHVYAGETRDVRINEFHEENATDVLAIPEKTFLKIENGNVAFFSQVAERARLFRRGQAAREFASPVNLTSALAK